MRVKETEPSYAARGSEMYHALYLPSDWVANASTPFPIIVEYAGNGPWTSAYGDYSPGTPEGSNLGFGLTAGAGAIWISMPFGDVNGSANQGWWWGCPPQCGLCNCTGYFNATPTLDYTVRTLQYVASRYGGDASAVVLLGFSRGAIAVNYFGHYDASMAALWRGSVAYAHYYGSPSDTGFPYPCASAACGVQALRRVRAPQFITQEQSAANATQQWIAASGVRINATYMSTGFCNHNDAWILRPSHTRDVLRAWYVDLLPPRARQRLLHAWA